MNRPVYIYALRDPRDWRIRYVGKTNRPSIRLRKHCNDQTSGHRGRWLTSVRTHGGKPVMELLELCVGNGIVEEAKWIKKYLEVGIKLVNTLLTGSPSPKFKLRGRVLTEDQKTKIRNSNVATWASEELRHDSAKRTEKQIASDPNWSARYRESKKKDWEQLTADERLMRRTAICEGRKRSPNTGWTNLTAEQREKRLLGLRAGHTSEIQSLRGKIAKRKRCQ